MARHLVTRVPTAEMGVFVKYFRKKKCIEAYLPLLETLPLQIPLRLQCTEVIFQVFVISSFNP